MCHTTDSRLESQSQGYHPIAPRLHALCAPPLVPAVISRGATRQVTWETSVSEGRNYRREMAGQLGLSFRLPRKSQGSFICRKSATWDRRLYFPAEGRHAVDFFGQNIRRLQPGSSWVPEASMLTTRPPTPLNVSRSVSLLFQMCATVASKIFASAKEWGSITRSQSQPYASEVISHFIIQHIRMRVTRGCEDRQ
jgi:hypothetical protein